MNLRPRRFAPSRVLGYAIMALLGLGVVIVFASRHEQWRWLVQYLFGLSIAIGILAIICVPYVTGSRRRRTDRDINL